MPESHRFRWVPAGERVEIASKLVPGGLLYLGQGLLAPTGELEPGLIDPDLPIDRANPDRAGEHLPDQLSFGALTPGSRAAFLTWMADGRRHPRTPIGYVLLYFFGLERRVLLDHLQRGIPDEDLRAIAREVEELLAVYGQDPRFGAHAREFLELIAAVLTVEEQVPPPIGVSDRRAPTVLRLGLGRFAANRSPVPAEWALAWQWYHPDVALSAVQTRCPSEFRRLFLHRYRERFGDGLVVDHHHRPVRLPYSAASDGLRGVAWEQLGVPDVLVDEAASQHLIALVRSVTDELEAFASYLGSHPEDRTSAAALSLLPAEIAPGEDSPTGRLVGWAGRRLGRDASVIVDSADIVRRWPDGDTMTAADVVACAQLLERHGIGLEPDPRLGGPFLGTGPAVLFEARGEVPRAASAEYAIAATVLQLAVAVGGVDGALLPVELDVMLEFLGSSLQLSPAERERLAAHLHWLSATGSRLNTLQHEVIDKLPLARRTAIGDVLLAVAASDGVISPDEVDVLETVFDMLGLDRELLRVRIAAGSLPSADNAEPPPSDPLGALDSSTLSMEQVRTAEPGTVGLDEKVLAASAASTAAVASLLGGIFTEPTPETDTDIRDADADDDADGLDGAHRQLLVALLRQARWTHAEFDLAARRVGLMPAGARDTLNDYAIDVCDDVLLETEDDAFVLNAFAVEALQI
jgi:tellurite resistance protein